MSLSDIPFCDVFYPTKEEFSNFENYIEKIAKEAKSGIVKVKSFCSKQVIPPRGWRARSDNYKDLDLVVPGPIEQIVSGKDGVYELIYLQRESRMLSKYKKLVEGFDKYLGDDYQETEKKFWKTIKFSSPLYGADASGSLFDKNVNWNLTEIQSILKHGLDKEIKGVTTPYLYFGSWKAMFAWHKEDLDLCSINYLHFGKPKFWYGIPPSDEQKFFDLAKKLYPEASKECSEFMRHKTFLFYPGLALSKGIQVNKCLQNPGEFVITLAKGYHAGFNMGFNCAEAVNFATKFWINLGEKAKSCDCQSGSVKVDMNYFMRNLIKKKKLDTKDKEESDQKIKKSSGSKKKLFIDKKSKSKQTLQILDNDDVSNTNDNIFLKRNRKLKEQSNNKAKKVTSRKKKI